jgi:hypothetical protein
MGRTKGGLNTKLAAVVDGVVGSEWEVYRVYFRVHFKVAAELVGVPTGHAHPGERTA